MSDSEKVLVSESDTFEVGIEHGNDLEHVVVYFYYAASPKVVRSKTEVWRAVKVLSTFYTAIT
jgi:hypothetical protein